MTGFPKADHIARTRIVETLQEAVLVLDWDDHILDVNDAAERQLGIDDSTYVGATLLLAGGAVLLGTALGR